MFHSCSSELEWEVEIKLSENSITVIYLLGGLTRMCGPSMKLKQGELLTVVWFNMLMWFWGHLAGTPGALKSVGSIPLLFYALQKKNMTVFGTSSGLDEIIIYITWPQVDAYLVFVVMSAHQCCNIPILQCPDLWQIWTASTPHPPHHPTPRLELAIKWQWGHLYKRKFPTWAWVSGGHCVYTWPSQDGYKLYSTPLRSRAECGLCFTLCHPQSAMQN